MASCLACTRLLVACACVGTVLGVEVCSPDSTTPLSKSLLQHIRIARPLEVGVQENDGASLVGLNASAWLPRTFGLLATQLPEGVTRELFARFKVCASCAKFQRFGETHDGGYLACMDGLAGSQLHAAYSIGVEYHDKWSEDVYNQFKVPVHQFDCTVASPAQRCGDCHFHKVCIAGARGGGSNGVGPNINMDQVLVSTGMSSAPDDSLVMKMDIEGAEWAIFGEGFTGLRKFGQLIVEFHWMDQVALHLEYIRALRNIESAGFRVAHLHGNNCCGMYDVGGFAIPRVLEVTFVRNSPTLGACETEQNLHPLDSQNVDWASDLPMAHLPA